MTIRRMDHYATVSKINIKLLISSIKPGDILKWHPKDEIYYIVTSVNYKCFEIMTIRSDNHKNVLWYYYTTDYDRHFELQCNYW